MTPRVPQPRPPAISAHVRWMIRRDMPDVLRIEEESFGEYRWAEEDFLRALRQRHCIGMVAERKHSDDVLGFMLYMLETRSIHLLTIAVAPAARRQDVGRQMIAKLVGKLSLTSGHRRTSIRTQTRETNLGAQRFLRACQFLAVDVSRGFFEDSGEDAYLFEYCLPGASGEARA